MAVTVNADCSEITLTSDIFNPANISNTLQVSVNGAVGVEVTIPADALTYTLVPQDLDVEEFAQGVYELKLSSVAFDSTSYTETTCTALLCDLLCDATTLSWYADKESFDKALALEGLKAASGCSECNCSITQTLYNHITNGDTSSCGCCCSTV
jgi:hypothetical protein